MTTSTYEIVETDVEVTFAEIIDGIEKNGWTQSYGDLWPSSEIKFKRFRARFDYYVEPENVNQACAFAQGMMNVNIMKFQGNHENWYLLEELYKFVSHLNDVDRKSTSEIAAEAREKYAHILDLTISGWSYETCKNNYIPNGSSIQRG